MYGLATEPLAKLRRLKHLCRAIGIKDTHAWRCGIYEAWGTGKMYFTWRPPGGQKQVHEFLAKDYRHLDDDELDLLRIKVRISQ